jgi:hypothetical protein
MINMFGKELGLLERGQSLTCPTELNKMRVKIYRYCRVLKLVVPGQRVDHREVLGER